MQPSKFSRVHLSGLVHNIDREIAPKMLMTVLQNKSCPSRRGLSGVRIEQARRPTEGGAVGPQQPQTCSDDRARQQGAAPCYHGAPPTPLPDS